MVTFCPVTAELPVQFRVVPLFADIQDYIGGHGVMVACLPSKETMGVQFPLIASPVV